MNAIPLICRDHNTNDSELLTDLHIKWFDYCRQMMLLVVKNLPVNTGNRSSMPGLGRSPGGGNDNLLQYSCLENPMVRGAWQATVHGVTKSQILFNATSILCVLSVVGVIVCFIAMISGEGALPFLICTVLAISLYFSMVFLSTIIDFYDVIVIHQKTEKDESQNQS